MQANQDTPFAFGQTDDVEVELASGWRRISAVLLNYVFAVTTMIPAIATSLPSASQSTARGGLLLSILIAFIFQIYQLVILCKHGQTLGKKLLGIKVIKTDGSHAGFVGAFLLREVVYSVGVGIVAAIVALLTASVASSSSASDTTINAISFLFTLVCVIMLFAHKERRTLQDLLAGTVVVKLPR